MPTTDEVFQYGPHQQAALDAEKRFNVRIWARRSGKTAFTVIRMITRLLQRSQGDWQAAFVAPTRLQSQQIAWPYLARYGSAAGGNLKVGELKCEFPGKGFIQLFSGEHYDRMRGLYLDDVVFDEAAQIPQAAWAEVVSAAIADRKGMFTAMGTPRGRMNLLFDLWEHAGSDPDWHRDMRTWAQAFHPNGGTMVDADEVERNRAQLSPAQFAQEWECSFDGSTPGAYWAEVMAQAEQTGRVTQIAYDDSLPVVAALDLGHHDLMPVVFAQEVGTECRVIDCLTYQFTGIPAMVRDWKVNAPAMPDRLILPHDARVTDLTSGVTRQEMFEQLGVETTIAPKIHLDEGIEQTRQFLKRCHFDREATRHLRQGLSEYRSDYDELRGVYRLKPIHDKASHYADAFRTLATGDRSAVGGYAPQPRLKGLTHA